MSGANHIATVTEANRAFQRPWHAQCSCGTSGDFKSKDEAASFMTTHLGRFEGVGVCTTELTFPEPKKISVIAHPDLNQEAPVKPPAPPAPKVA